MTRVGAGRLSLAEAGLLVGVTTLWGFNFVPIRWALSEIPPFALAATRFALAAFPMIVFVRRPKVPLVVLAGYGLAIGLGQFGLLFLAIRLGMPAGLASLLVQTQVFLTIALAALVLRDRIRLIQVAGACLAGLGLVALVSEKSGGAGVYGSRELAMVLGAAACWAIGNVTAKAAARRYEVDMFALVVWSSLVSPLPLAALSWYAEGPAGIASLARASPLAWASVLFMAFGATLFGFAAWNRMLHRHSAGLVAPFALLVPIAGLASAAVFLGESLTTVEAVAALVILLGLAVTLAGERMRTRPATRIPSSQA